MRGFTCGVFHNQIPGFAEIGESFPGLGISWGYNPDLSSTSASKWRSIHHYTKRLDYQVQRGDSQAETKATRNLNKTSPTLISLLEIVSIYEILGRLK